MTPDIGDIHKIRKLVVAIGGVVDKQQPTNIELMQAVAFVIGQTLNSGVETHDLDEDMLDQACEFLSRLTKTAAKLCHDQAPDETLSRAMFN